LKTGSKFSPSPSLDIDANGPVGVARLLGEAFRITDPAFLFIVEVVLAVGVNLEIGVAVDLVQEQNQRLDASPSLRRAKTCFVRRSIFASSL
jgi:hypothetical protein